MNKSVIRLLVPGAWYLVPTLLLSACAEITPPGPQEVLESPFGKEPLRIGMSKDEVRALWGEPRTVEEKGRDSLGSTREIWIYEPSIAASVPKVLEFDGENLVAFHD